MRPINVIITGGGAPGIVGTIYSLRNNFDKRRIKIITTDIKDECVGKYLSDRFYKIPPAKDVENYKEAIYTICKKEKIDVIIPQNTIELLTLAKEKKKLEKLGIRTLVSDVSTIEITNDKASLLNFVRENNLNPPNYYIVESKRELIESLKLLGWPKEPVVVKLPISHGSIGTRIIDDNIEEIDLFLNHKPTSLFIRSDKFLAMFQEKIPKLIVMEYLPGDEISVDVCQVKQRFVIIPRKRIEIRSGISFINEYYENDELIKITENLSKLLKLKHVFGIQFKIGKNKQPKLLECNPRVQGTMIYATLAGINIIYLAIKQILGENIDEIPKFFSKNLKLYRYWGAVGVDVNKITVV
jgi:carbamoyl-phosphate synthase large subunit